jgi:drug/metabolite transporter (DMT)-like permease
MSSHDPSVGTPTRRPWLGALAIDSAAVLVFVVAGRDSHDADAGVGSVLGVAAPFLIGLVVGWLVTPGARHGPLAMTTGAGVWIATVGVGLLLRRTLWDRGTALPFVIVTALVLGLLMHGWRGIWSLGTRRREIRSPSPP